MNERLQKLGDDAEATARIKRHDLGIWRVLGEVGAAHAYGNRCKGEVYIAMAPMGDGYAIIGPAAAPTCRGTN